MKKYLDDLSGMVYGNLSVICPTYVSTLFRYVCRCKCGKIVYVSPANLLNGHAKSCGCARKYEKKSTETSLLFDRYKEVMNRAIRMRIDFSLDFESFRTLSYSPCFYCGMLPANPIQIGNTPHYIEVSGLDRKDSNEGYTLDNVVPCCFGCNATKSTMSFDAYIEFIKRHKPAYNWQEYARKES